MGVRKLERVVVVFFVLAVLFAAGVVLADPSIYAQTLLLAPFPADRSPLMVGLFVAGLLPDPYPLWYSLLRMGDCRR